MIKYRIICPLNDNLTTFRVKCTEDDKLYIKKILDRPQFEIYKIIQEKDYDGVPKIKELFYSPENDKYILYEECVPGYTIDELFKKGTQFSKKFVIKMATALCNILKPIHNDNLIHRDISPNNVMYSQIEDKFYLIDFGNSRNQHTKRYCFCRHTDFYGARTRRSRNSIRQSNGYLRNRYAYEIYAYQKYHR